MEISLKNSNEPSSKSSNDKATAPDLNLHDVVLKPKKWSDLTRSEKIAKSLKTSIVVLAILSLLILFFSSISLLSLSFKIISGKNTRQVFSIADNPMAGLCIGILATIIFQSSSTTTSISVGLVASGALSVGSAIAIVMGANIGTSITNTLVSLGHADNKTEFRKAIQGATVHDFFNIFLLLLFLPLEQIPLHEGKGLLETLSFFMVKPISGKNVDLSGDNYNVFKLITKPIVALFIKKNSCVLGIFQNQSFGATDKHDYYVICTTKCASMCPEDTEQNSVYGSCGECLFENMSFITGGLLKSKSLADNHSAAIGVAIAIMVMTTSLVLMAKILSRSLKKRTSGWIKKALLKHGVVAMLLGALITIIVQSSSITTSTLVPLVALDIITLHQMFPITLGANVGTTMTALLASISESEVNGIQIALCHLLFNFLGILIFYPIPYVRSLPIVCAEALGYKVSRNRLYGVLYILVTFIIAPFLLLGLSFVKGGAVVGAIVIYASITFVFIWRQIRIRRPSCIPLWCPAFMKPNRREEEEAANEARAITRNLI